MRAIKAQYFFAFAVMGSLLPFLSLYLAERGLCKPQIGYVTSAGSFSLMLTPVLLALLADTHISPRRALAGVFAVAGAFVFAMWWGHGFYVLLAIWVMHALAFAPITALQDALNFGAMKQRRDQGLPTQKYHRVRVWGTLGFIVPSVGLYWFVQERGLVDLAMPVAGGFAMLGLINTFLLPELDRAHREQDVEQKLGGNVPTIAALKQLREPHLLTFCVAMFLILAASAAYYAFYPVYLDETIGLEKQWVALVMNLGVVFELGYMLAFGYLTQKLGLRTVILVGMVAMALRYILLAAVPTLAVAVGVQVLHGATVLVLHVAPPIFINRYASARFRASMHGVYLMLVVGGGRIVGNFAAGHLAEWSLTGLFAVAASLCVLAIGVVLFALADAGGAEADHEAG